jgi:CelD/BcsL family acetyltransferase involved in cellulose biosynthesis
MQVAARIEWLGEPERFEQLGPDWERMLPPDARPFDTHTWYRSWYRAFGAEGEMRICLAWEGERLVAAMPLMERRRRWLSAMANVHSPVYRPVGCDAAAVRSVVEAVLARGGGKVSMSALPSDDVSLPMMAELATQARRRHVQGAERTSPIVELDGDFGDWRARSKPRWGAPLERFRRKMTREHDAQLVIVEAPSNLDYELARGFAVEASGWKGASGTAIISDPRTETFYREVASSFAERDELRLSRVVLDGHWAAFDLCVLYRRRLYLLKTGYDERFRRLAPGLVMRLSTIERCFELGLEAHELLGDDAEWKRKFSTTERRHVVFHAYEPGLVGNVGYTYRSAARPLLKRAYDGALAFRRA